METILHDTVPVRQDLITGFSKAFDTAIVVLCSLVVLIDFLSIASTLTTKFFDPIVKFFTKLFSPDPVRDILVCRINSDENGTQLLSTTTALYQLNGHLTHVKPAGHFYLLIFPMQLYIMFIIFSSKIVNEQQTSIREINLTVSFEEQTKFYQCSNNTRVCTSYTFNKENVIDTVTNLITWWVGLESLKNKLIFLLHKELIKMHRQDNRLMQVRCRILLFRCTSWIFVLLFVVYVVSGIREMFGVNWFPLVLSVILGGSAISSVSAELTATWLTLDLEKKRLIAHEKELNNARLVLILDAAHPESVLETLAHQSAVTTSMFLPHRTLNKITPSNNEPPKF